MALTTDSNYSYTGNQSNDLVLFPAYNKPELRSRFRLVPDIKGKLNVHYLKRGEKLLVKDTGASFTPSDINLTHVQKQWNPVDMIVWKTLFRGDLAATHLEWLLNTGNDKTDLTNTVINDILIDLVSDAVYADTIRQAWFASSAYVNGDLTGGSGDIANYKTFDGFWKKITDAVTASTINRYQIEQNDGSASPVLEEGAALTIFKGLYSKQSRLLNGTAPGDKRMHVSRAIADNYMEYLESRNLDAAYVSLQNGITTMTWRGIPIIVEDEWDVRIAADFTLNSIPDRPFRAILTAADNLQLGYNAIPQEMPTDNPLNIWYNPDTRKWNGQVQFSLDTQIAVDDLITVGY